MNEFVTQHQFDLIWIIIASAMVMFMQAGFTALESGLTQSEKYHQRSDKEYYRFYLQQF
ncbi:MAG: hypothetical protein LRY63_11605 [Nitrincola sp.]|nr:hypothetical protein [Nitrincola sp.]